MRYKAIGTSEVMCLFIVLLSDSSNKVISEIASFSCFELLKYDRLSYKMNSFANYHHQLLNNCQHLVL